ncbi:MAG: DNA primase [Candidatus Levybacteria bacterium]|nr:DNA primase [Candidatus Levybacteria bacterium]
MDEVSQIREKIDLVSFISEYLPLKKMGRNFTVVCPFHSEKTPSFVVSPERQIWHCFSCSKGGDAYTFLMEYENIEFGEALRILAKKTGIELRQSEFRKGQSSLKEKLFEINKLSLKFYKYILLEHSAGKPARDYLLEKRKLNKGIIDTFDLGFSPNTQSSLSDYLVKKKGFKPQDLLDAGISIQRNGKLMDFFRNRIIFPLFDHRGNVSGFSGRSLNETDMPKYINTKETPVYHKGSLFFGLNLAKEEIKQKADVIIVEGEFDTISLFMEGIKNVIAIKGTALTEEQVTLISRFSPKATLCLDQDEAGFEATKRSLLNLEKKGLTTNTIVLENAKDPDEAIKKDPIAFKKALKEAVNIYDFLISAYLSQNPKDTIEGKKKITQNLLPLFSQISNEIIKEHYIKKLSTNLDTSIESINREIEKIQKLTQEKIVPQSTDKRPRREILEEYLLSLIIQSPKQKETLEENKKLLKDYKFEVPAFLKILDSLSVYFAKNQNFDNRLFSNYLDSSLQKSFDVCFLYPLPKLDTFEKWSLEAKKVSFELLNLYAKERLKEITDEIKKTEDKESAKALKLKEEFSAVLRLLSQKA